MGDFRRKQAEILVQTARLNILENLLSVQLADAVLNGQFPWRNDGHEEFIGGVIEEIQGRDRKQLGSGNPPEQGVSIDEAPHFSGSTG